MAFFLQPLAQTLLAPVVYIYTDALTVLLVHVGSLRLTPINLNSYSDKSMINVIVGEYCNRISGNGAITCYFP